MYTKLNFGTRCLSREPKDAHFYAKNIWNSVTLCSVASRRVSISALHKTHAAVLFSRGNEKPDISVLIQHNVPWGIIFISVSGILKRKETEMCVSCGFVTSNTPCSVISSFACFWHADISQPTANRKSPRIILFTFRCGTHTAHCWMVAL